MNKREGTSYNIRKYKVENTTYPINSFKIIKGYYIQRYVN